ncbi:MAG: hypothetical protein A2Z16_02060 [Chloroflexi bacterium RBG_16_54_18]|nr:MAG: hypothetical protein A2Z16_02060 [Chloroflexi bacterium RBG_16_54_18]
MHKRTTAVFWGICVLALIVSACQGASEATGQIVETINGSYTSISVPELAGMLENKDFTLINVRIPWQGDIPQTDLKLAYDQIEQSQTQLPADKYANVGLLPELGYGKGCSRFFAEHGLHQSMEAGRRHNRLERRRVFLREIIDPSANL